MINYQEHRYYLRRAVKTYYDLQAMQIRLMNRIGLKKDKTGIKRETVVLADELAYYLTLIEEIEERLHGKKKDDEGLKVKEKDKTGLKQVIKKELELWPVWTEYLKGVLGVGWTVAAVICAEYDIEESTNVSKMWQFTGLNPGMVRGRKNSKGKSIKVDTMVRGDKLTPGYLAPFNKWLRTKMIGVLGSSFMKLKDKSEYRKIYDDEKLRLEHSESICENTGKMWKDEKPGHRHNAAVRKMIKMFLKDLYPAWRTLEGLEVRAPYKEEYLGHKH